MSTLAERLRKLGPPPMQFSTGRDWIWPEICEVVEAAEWIGQYAMSSNIPGLKNRLDALALRMDEENL